MQKIFWLLILIFTTVCAPAETRVTSSSSQAQIFDSTCQMILVTTDEWSSVPGVLQRFERKNTTSTWKPVGRSISVVVGRNGLGWGRGLHQGENSGGPLKREGDGKSPAGIFRLSSAFGLAEPKKAKWVKLSYCQLLPGLECVDDVKSAHYNSIVHRDKIKNPDWNSSEKMREIGEEYRWGVTVDHNTDPKEAGGGSCIFLHIWKNAGTGTSGCTAMAPEKMKTVLRWLDPAKNPVLVQLPESEFRSLRTQWKLPQGAEK
jgi:L,D-peptidoglycan transpeptidase YkuD (ErfK/YbiS/YcfS/YnhG family)